MAGNYKAHSPRRKALLIGNSDGIGLAATRRLLAAGWDVAGISRSESPITAGGYQHYVANVSDREYSRFLDDLISGSPPDLCIYFVGIGVWLNLADMKDEPRVIDVNLTGMVKTASAIIPGMVGRGHGHFIGISSLADSLPSAEAPSYAASKAGFTIYIRGLAQALTSHGVHVTNIRFGFVDTKMAKGNFRPFMMSVERAVDHLERCIIRKPGSYTAPRIAIPLIALTKALMLVKNTVGKNRKRRFDEEPPEQDGNEPRGGGMSGEGQ